MEQVGPFTRVADDLAVLDIVRVIDPALAARDDQYALLSLIHI